MLDLDDAGHAGDALQLAAQVDDFRQARAREHDAGDGHEDEARHGKLQQVHERRHLLREHEVDDVIDGEGHHEAHEGGQH